MKDIEKRRLCFKQNDVIVTQYINTADTDIFVGSRFRVAEDTEVTSLDSKIPIILKPSTGTIYHIRFRDVWKVYRDGELLYHNNAWYQSWPPVSKKLDCEG